MRASARLKAGDWVEVLPADEIRRTLDEHAQLEGMPFMPEMARFCGRRFRVQARAHKSCDTVEYVGGRRLWGAVHLEGLRCDGTGHGACEALCLLFWKEGWLRKVEGPGPPLPFDRPEPRLAPEMERLVQLGTRRPGEPADAPNPTYVCQATQLLVASVPLKRSDVAQYLEDLFSGNVGLWRMVVGFSFFFFEMVARGRYGIGAPLRALYDLFQRLIGGSPYPSRPGLIPRGEKTPSRRLDLVAGELVRVRSLPEILATVDVDLRNRGMGFHTEMVPFTGRTFRVLRRVEHIVHEKTGKMVHLRNDAIILEGATCQARYMNNCRRFCPRAVYAYFREIWLERVEEPGGPRPAPGTQGP
jgi:hypothetical protein